MHFLIKLLSFLDLYSSYSRTTTALLNRFSLTALNNDTIGGRKIGPCMSFDCNRLGADHLIPAMTLTHQASCQCRIIEAFRHLNHV